MPIHPRTLEIYERNYFPYRTFSTIQKIIDSLNVFFLKHDFVINLDSNNKNMTGKILNNTTDLQYCKRIKGRQITFIEKGCGNLRS
jgi:hypothetical protein